MAQNDWLALDWGTSNVRLWHMRGAEIVSHAESASGMGQIATADYPAALTALVEKAGAPRGLTAIICGMAGAKTGWREAGYVDVPCSPEILGRNAVEVDAGPAAARAFILPGVCQRGVGSQDVMRGEETQIAGFLLDRPDPDGLLVLPGTHSKWVRISGGRIESFATVMTGELFALLCEHSILRLSVSGPEDPALAQAGLAAGLSAGIAAPERLGAGLFGIRAASLLSDRQPAWSRAYLSGLLIGSEVAGMATAMRGSAEAVTLIGSPRLMAIYADAFSLLGLRAQPFSGEDAVVRGLVSARRHLEQLS